MSDSHECLLMLTKGPACYYDRHACRAASTMKPQRRLTPAVDDTPRAGQPPRTLSQKAVRGEPGTDGDGHNLWTVWQLEDDPPEAAPAGPDPEGTPMSDWRVEQADALAFSGNFGKS